MKKITSFLLTSLFFATLNLFAQTPPRAYDVGLQGNTNIGSVITGIYSFADTNNRPEGNSLYKWYRADSITQINPEAIDSAWLITYVTTIADSNKYLAFEVTPVAAGTGDSLIGNPVRVWTDKMITRVGINDQKVQISFFPNPSSDFIIIQNTEPWTDISIYSADGRIVLQANQSQRIDISNLHSGIYIIKVVFRNSKNGTARLIKL